MTVPVAHYRSGGTIIGRVRTEYGLTAGPATTQNLGSGPYTGTTTASYETVTLNNPFGPQGEGVSGLKRTPRWREKDSNPWSLLGTSRLMG